MAAVMPVVPPIGIAAAHAIAPRLAVANGAETETKTTLEMEPPTAGASAREPPTRALEEEEQPEPTAAASSVRRQSTDPRRGSPRYVFPIPNPRPPLLKCNLIIY